MPILKGRIRRKKRFNDFINNDLNLSNEKYNEEKYLTKIRNDYDFFVCGSDQIWNPLKTSDFSLAYMLNFTKKEKIAYAPSIGLASKDDLSPYKDLLLSFKAISCREKGGSKVLSKITKKDVAVVLDPTLLIEKEVFLQFTEEMNCDPYLFYYSLDGYGNSSRNMDIISRLANKFNLQIKMITPEWPYHNNIGENIIDAGPKEYLTLIRNAALVCTNSFHGTALSLKLERPIFVLEDVNIKDERKRSILNQLGLQNRILSTLKQVDNLEEYTLDYVPVLSKMNDLKNESVLFLKNALRDD